MKIRIRRNWFDSFRIFCDDDNDYSYSGHSSYLIGKGNHLKLRDKNKEPVLYIEEGNIGVFDDVNRTSYLVHLLKEKKSIELKCLDYQSGQWAFDVDQDKYMLDFQRGQTGALFKNGVRVASYIEKNGELTITSIDTEDPVLLTSLHLVFNINND